MRIARPKVIFDPIHNNPIDVDSFISMVDAPEFQLLRERRQLSLTDLVFPSARHSRFEHSLGSFYATRRLADRWVVQRFIDVEMRRALAGYALYHDIGHAAFSHVTEDFCGEHKIRAQELVTALRPAIERSNVNFDLMYSLITHQNPIHLAVSDKNIGIEKLDYLERDGWYTGIGKPEGVVYLRKFMYFVNGCVCIDEKMVDHVVRTMDFYMQMFKNVYLRKCLVIAQRTFHKMLYYVIQSGELDPKRLPEMTDAELLGVVLQTQHQGASRLIQRIRRRELLKEAVVIRSESQMHETRVLAKKICVTGVSDTKMAAIMQSPTLKKANHQGLEDLECRVARLLKIKESDVAIVPALYADRFVPKDVLICGSNGNLHSLLARRPGAFGSMEETARSYHAVRVCVPDEHREGTCRAAPAILELVQDA